MPPRAPDLARSRWRGILATCGVPDAALTGKHTACPSCGGTDRFRFDNKEGRGTWICSRCGSGDGFDLLQLMFGWNFAEAAKRIEGVVGGVREDKVSHTMTSDQIRELQRDLWRSSSPVRPGDPVDLYLRSRGLLHPQPDALRYAPSCYYDGTLSLPAMVAVVSGRDGRPATLHRTYLGVDGKAKVGQPRKLMPGPVPEGAAVRLAPPAEVMGIAEGIETALAAAQLFGLPVWAAISAGMLEKWHPPEGCRKVVIMADADRRFRGQQAAYNLAARLANSEVEVEVRVPRAVGTDWNDVLLSRAGAAAAFGGLGKSIAFRVH